jgi:hypothetical protein
MARGGLLLLCLLLSMVAGCASVPGDDPLVWSDDVVRTLPREQGDEVEVARFSRLPPGAAPAPWQPWQILRGNIPTRYTIVDVDGTSALEAESAEGGSGMWRAIRVDPARLPVLEWRWRLPRPAPGEPSLAATSSRSPVARVSLAFHGDTSKLDFDDRTKLRLANLLTTHGLPYATLLYVWRVGVPIDTVMHSPHTDRVRMIVVENSEQRTGEWIRVRRNVVADFRRAFGEDPGDVVAVGLMTDYGDDGSPRRAYYGDITFEQR